MSAVRRKGSLTPSQLRQKGGTVRIRGKSASNQSASQSGEIEQERNEAEAIQDENEAVQNHEEQETSQHFNEGTNDASSSSQRSAADILADHEARRQAQRDRAPQKGSQEKRPLGSHLSFGGPKSKLFARRRLISREPRKDALSGITNNDLRRLARRGGVKRVSAAIYPEARRAMRDFVRPLLGNIAAIVEMRKQQTVTYKDVIYALKFAGKTLYGFSNDVKAKR
ncbi:hypothetical protein PYCC9005_003277 [Savitreella phatthalungensis]